MTPHNKDQMHAEDKRNLVIFAVLSILLWVGYDYFIMAPQKAEMEKAQKMAREQAALEDRDYGSDTYIAPAGAMPRHEMLGKNERIDIDNGSIYGSISLTGGRIDDIAFSEFYDTLEKKNNVILLSPKNTDFPRYIDHGWVAGDKSVTVPGAKTRWYVQGNSQLTPETPVTLLWNNGQGLFFERVYTIDESYLITLSRKVTNTSGKEITLYPYGLISQGGLPPTLAATWISHEGPIGYMGEELAEISYRKMRKNETQRFKASQGWAGIADKYWLTSLIPPQGKSTKFSFTYTGDGLSKSSKSGRYQVDYTGAPMVLAAGETGQSESRIFTGAKKVLQLKSYEKDLNIPKLSLAVNFGWFWFMATPFFYVLHFLGEFTGNLGIAIILLTIVVRSAVFPLTNASYKSFAKMKKVTPEVGALREQYGDDKKKLQEEIAKMYQREGVNPLAGCLPIFLQIPIFFALYKVLFLTIEIRHAPFFGWIKDLSAPDPTSVFNLFGLIPWDPPSILMIGAWPMLMLVAMLMQKHLNPPPQDKMQREMALYFPFIMTFVLANFASGLVLYWTFSAYLGLIQQMIIMRSMGVPIYLLGQREKEENLEKTAEDGPDVHPLIEMVEDEVEDALFDKDENVAPPTISPPKPKKKKKKK